MKTPISMQCAECGAEFYTKEEGVEICLACRIIEDLKLPEDTIVNQNMVNIWTAKKYDATTGIDRVYLMIAEGVYLVERRQRTQQLCSRMTFVGSKDDEAIGTYAANIRNRKDIRSKFDAMVFVRVSPKSDFKVFGISYSDRIQKKLSAKSVVFQKQYAISLAVKWYYRKAKTT